MFSFFCKLNKTLEKINGLRTARRSYQGLTDCVFFVVFISIMHLIIIRAPFPYKGEELRHGSNNGTILEWRNMLVQTPNNALGISRVTDLMPQGNFLGDGSPEFVTGRMSSLPLLNFDGATLSKKIANENADDGCSSANDVRDILWVHRFLLGSIMGFGVWFLLIKPFLS